MSLNKHIFANYTGVVVTTLLTFLVVPFYLKWLGPDAYGLIGIATMIQAWTMLLNAGFGPVAGRQAAQAQGGTASWQETSRFIRTIDWLVAGLSLPIVFTVFFSRHWLAEHWLEKNSLGTETVALSLVLLILMTVIRLATSVSRGVIANLEEQVWLNINLVIFNVWRYGVSLPIVYFWPNVNVLFVWWLFITALEYLSAQAKISVSIPVPIPFFVFDTSELKKHGKMATTLAVTSGILIVVTNLDKLLLASLLPLANYGYFSIAALLASSVLILAQPIAQAFQPRLTKAYASGGMEAACNEFRQCTHWTVLLVFPVGAVIFAMPESILTIWTHDHLVAVNAANILRGYVLGSTLFAVGSLLYVMQVAMGNVSWHLRSNLIFAAILFPGLPLMVSKYGAEGAAWLWAGFNFVLFVVWNVFLLRKLLKPLFPQWILIDTLLPMLVSFAIALSTNYLFINNTESISYMLMIVISLSLFIFSVLWFLTKEKKNEREIEQTRMS
jgi:O-antigen/teichoic acid export membrane protein